MQFQSEPVRPATAVLPRFGDVAYVESDVIVFPWGIPGFEGCRRWLFLTLESQPNFFWLQSLDRPEIAFPAAAPRSVFEWYVPPLPPELFTALDITGAADFATLCTVVVGPGAKELTMNLQAPIVVNLRTRTALQYTLPGNEYSSRHAIPRTIDGSEAVPTAKAS